MASRSYGFPPLKKHTDEEDAGGRYRYGDYSPGAGLIGYPALTLITTAIFQTAFSENFVPVHRHASSMPSFIVIASIRAPIKLGKYTVLTKRDACTKPIGKTSG